MQAQPEINCAEACVNGCVLGDRCPHREYAAQASQFINQTSLDRMHEIADEALKRKQTQTTEWVIPDDI
jgi:hypothetical protein